MVLELTDLTYKPFIKDGLTVIKAWADNCGPCSDFEPVFENVSNEIVGHKFGSIKVAKDSPSEFRRTHMVAKKIGDGIGTPMTFLFENGKEVRRHYGMLQETDLMKFIVTGLPDKPVQKDLKTASEQDLKARLWDIEQEHKLIMDELMLRTKRR